MARAYTAILAAAVIALNFSTSLLAGPFEDGMNAYDRADYSTALRMWRSLADQGNPAAQSNLALMYAKGQGVPKDYVQAYMWSALSAARGHQDGVKNRDGIAKGMTPAQISDAQKRAGAWKPVGGPVQAQASAPTPAQTSAPQSSRSGYTTTTTIIRR
jgi:TPR repeat protein